MLKSCNDFTAIALRQNMFYSIGTDRMLLDLYNGKRSSTADDRQSERDADSEKKNFSGIVQIDGETNTDEMNKKSRSLRLLDKFRTSSSSSDFSAKVETSENKVSGKTSDESRSDVDKPKKHSKEIGENI